MSVRLSTLQNNLRSGSIEIELGGETPRKEEFRFQFRPTTPKMIKEIEAAARDDTSLNVDAALMTRVLTKWDLEGDDERPLEVNQANIEALPVGMLAAMRQVVVAVTNPRSSDVDSK